MGAIHGYYVQRINAILNYLHLQMNWLYKFVMGQTRNYFGHVTRHNGLEKTITQGMVAREMKQRKVKTKLAKKTSQIYSGWRKTPEEDA